MMKCSSIIHLTILLVYLVNTPLHAQTSSTENNNKISLNKAYLKSYFTNTRDVLLFPKHFSSGNWIVAGVFVGATGLLMAHDKKIQRFALEQRSTGLDNLSKHALEPFGGVYSLAAMGAFYLQGEIFKNDRSKKTALLGVESYLISGFIVTIPKYLLGRHRPNADSSSGPNLWEGPSLKHRSFPSGHTTSAFSVATVVALEYNESIIVPVISYTVASLVGFSRVYDNKHWASDVVAGAGLGTLVGYIVHKQSSMEIKIKPSTDENLDGLTLVFPINHR